MTKLEYAKIRMERRKNSRLLLDRAISVGMKYPVDLHYFWDFMQAKGVGLPYCLGMIYNLGFSDGSKQHEKGPSPVDAGNEPGNKAI